MRERGGGRGGGKERGRGEEVEEWNGERWWKRRRKGEREGRRRREKVWKGEECRKKMNVEGKGERVGGGETRRWK